MKIIATHVDDSFDELRARIDVERRRRGKAIDRYFYRSHLVFETELTNLIFKSWIYAAHISEVPNPGDFTLFEVGEDSLIITRDKEGKIRALMNVCRHRGARVCEKEKGNTKTFVCPYHKWTYNLDGTLRAARHMDMLDGFDAADYPLKEAKVCVYMGLIFVNFDQNAGDFLGPLSNVEAQLGAYELDKAKIIRKETYKVDANWKFCLENYLECYHCTAAHPHYAKMHTLEDLYCNVKDQLDEMLKRAPEITGVPGIEGEYKKIYHEAESFGACVYTSRYGLYDGYLTGSQDGKPVAPLMGKIKGYDGGVGDFQFGPLSFMLNYPDHCVMYRFIPRGLTETDMQIVWYVNGDAEEGKDYDADKVAWLWHYTTLEDEFIIKRNSEGANSQFFEPGPYHPEYEETLQDFIDWYLATLERAAARKG
ncbi:MAG: aromatic ring-hydroxylating dioxygenase subunit alpha [Parvularculaceae bacterium]